MKRIIAWIASCAILLTVVFLSTVFVRPVVLTDTGFIPPAARVHVGGIVVFINLTSHDFWPASNPHPAHTIYSRFDPKQPVRRIFVFRPTQVGAWGYHDHIASTFRGRVIAYHRTLLHPEENCVWMTNAPINQIQQCWENIAAAMVQEKGFEYTLNNLSTLYEQDAHFGENCHEFTHQVGHAATTLYREFKKTHRIFLPTTSSACGYGFFHGLLENWVTQGATIAEVKEFCVYLEKTYAPQMPNIGTNCYHGAGHGFQVYSLRSDFSKEKIEAILAQCKEFDRGKNDCASALFSGIASYVATLPTKPPNEELFTICTQFPEYTKDCIPGFMSALVDLSRPITESAVIAYTLTDPTSSSRAIYIIAKTYARQHELTRDEIEQCRAIRMDLTQGCIRGLANGKMETAKPHEELAFGFAFCTQNELSTIENQWCLEEVLSTATLSYSSEEIYHFCATMEITHISTCKSSFQSASH